MLGKLIGFACITLIFVGCSGCPSVHHHGGWMTRTTYSISWQGDKIFYNGGFRGVDMDLAYDIAAERFCRGEWPWEDAVLPGRNKAGHRIYPLFDVMMGALVDSLYEAQHE